MRLKTIIKELDEILQMIDRRDRKFIERIRQLKSRLELKQQEEEAKEYGRNPAVYPLIKWYASVWEGKIPEGNIGRVAKVFKELLEDFKIETEEIKELYQFWLSLENVPKNLEKRYSIILTAKETRSIADFKGKLRYIKGLKRELENSGSKWTSKENERGIDYYLKPEEEEPEWWK